MCCCRQVLEERRARCEDVDSDVIVWTNQRLKHWAKHVDLQVTSADNININLSIMLTVTTFTSLLLRDLTIYKTSRS